MCRIRTIKRIMSESSGFTLVEALVALGILSVAVGLIGSGLFQVLSFQKPWQDQVVATKELRHAGSWFAGDALNTEEVFDAGGSTRLTCDPDPAVEKVTLQWIGKDGVTTHNVTYSLTGQDLIRNYDGNPNIVASPVVLGTLSFSLCGNLLSLKMDVEADRGTTDDIVLQTYTRRLKP